MSERASASTSSRPRMGNSSSINNPLEQVRLRSVHEAEDVQNIVHMIVDPHGKGLNDHWVKTGAALLTGAILHLLYAEANKTLRGLAGFLSDPHCTLMETIERMLSAEHDRDGSMCWRDYRGEATRDPSDRGRKHARGPQ